MTEEQRTFCRLASLCELLDYQQVGGSVPREAWARAAREADERAAAADAAAEATAYLAGGGCRYTDGRPARVCGKGADAA